MRVRMYEFSQQYQMYLEVKHSIVNNIENIFTARFPFIVDVCTSITCRFHTLAFLSMGINVFYLTNNGFPFLITSTFFDLFH